MTEHLLKTALNLNQLSKQYPNNPGYLERSLCCTLRILCASTGTRTLISVLYGVDIISKRQNKFLSENTFVESR